MSLTGLGHFSKLIRCAATSFALHDQLHTQNHSKSEGSFVLRTSAPLLPNHVMWSLCAGQVAHDPGRPEPVDACQAWRLFHTKPGAGGEV
jgi:hypothetical protein